MLAQQPSIVQAFKFAELLPGLVICEAPAADPHGWGNAHADEPAFLIYLGYNIPQEREEWIARSRKVGCNHPIPV